MKEKRRSNLLTSLSDIFGKSDLRKNIWKQNDFYFRALKNKWQDIAGDILAKESYIAYEKKDTIFIYVTNSVWMHELFMQKSNLLQKINQDAYGKKFKNIRFLPAIEKKEILPKTSISSINNYFNNEHQRYDIHLTEKENQNINTWIHGHVKNNKIKPLLENYMKGAFTRKKGDIEAGYHPCLLCQDYIPKDQKICFPCLTKLEQSKIGKIILILKEHPDYQYQDVKDYVICHYSTYETAREQLIQRIRQKIYLKIDAPFHKRFLLSLLLHKPLKNISLREAEQALRNLPQTKNDVINQK